MNTLHERAGLMLASVGGAAVFMLVAFAYLAYVGQICPLYTLCR